ncbi:MAG: TetR/AcrR family transcriptional regulator [Nitrospirota bacterium]
MEKKLQGKKELIQQFRTEGILAAARIVISKRGLDKATMEQVADEAGISKATIYLYFKNKEELYYRCVVDRMDELLALMDEMAGIADPMERLRKLMLTQVEFIDSERDFFKVYLIESRELLFDKTSECGLEFARRYDRLVRMMSGCIKECMDGGKLREMDPLKTHYLLFSMIRGMAIYGIMCGKGGLLSEEASVVLDIFLNGMRA